MNYLFETFWRHCLDIGALFPSDCEFLVCLSVCQLAYFFTEIIQIQGYLQFQIRYFSEIFWRHPWDAGTLFPNNSEFLVCLTVCWFAYFLTKLRQREMSSTVCYIDLKLFGGFLGMFLHYIQIILNFFYVCQSVIWLTSLLKLHKVR